MGKLIPAFRIFISEPERNCCKIRHLTSKCRCVMEVGLHFFINAPKGLEELPKV